MPRSTESASGRSWSHVQLGRFILDEKGIEVDGEWWEPTYNWFAQLTARRSDGIDFFVVIPIDHELWEATEDKILFMQQRITAALEQLETYRQCACTLKSRCNIHAGPPPPAELCQQEVDRAKGN